MNVSGKTCDLERVDDEAITNRESSWTRTSAKIFISYRRTDDSWPVRWLTDALTDHFGRGVVFQDVDSIRPGDDFAAEIVAAVKRSLVLITVMGLQWQDVGCDGRRRIDDPEDWVRVEIETAISCGIRIIPILVHGARMPDVSELPPSLQSLTRRQYVVLNPIHPDMHGLVAVLENTIRS